MLLNYQILSNDTMYRTKPCIKIDKTLVFYIFTNGMYYVMTLVNIILCKWQNIYVFMQKKQKQFYKVILVSNVRISRI